MTTTTDWGTDLNALPDGDLDPLGTEITGDDIPKQRLFRRFTTERGGLFYDLTFGESLIALLSAAFTEEGRMQIRDRVVKQAVLDVAVDSADAVVDYNHAIETATITITCNGASGPFALVLAIDKVSVRILNDQQI